MLVLLVVLAAGCGGRAPTKQSGPPSRAGACKESDGPSADTVRRSIASTTSTASVPTENPGTSWVEIARGHTNNCRLYWVQIIPTIASESTPQQLLFFDHNTPLGTPTPNPKPYITVLPPADDTVTVQYRWRKGKDQECCPTGIGTVKFTIGPDSKLQAVGKVPDE